jgi:hypothetical protein
VFTPRVYFVGQTEEVVYFPDALSDFGCAGFVRGLEEPAPTVEHLEGVVEAKRGTAHHYLEQGGVLAGNGSEVDGTDEVTPCERQKCGPTSAVQGEIVTGILACTIISPAQHRLFGLEVPNLCARIADDPVRGRLQPVAKRRRLQRERCL